jgi:hypothetical protein
MAAVATVRRALSWIADGIANAVLAELGIVACWR